MTLMPVSSISAEAYGRKVLDIFNGALPIKSENDNAAGQNFPMT